MTVAVQGSPPQEMNGSQTPAPEASEKPDLRIHAGDGDGEAVDAPPEVLPIAAGEPDAGGEVPADEPPTATALESPAEPTPTPPAEVAPTSPVNITPDEPPSNPSPYRRRYDWEQDPHYIFELAIRKARETAADAGLNVLDLQEQLKDAKETAKEAVKEYRRLKEKGPEKRPLFDNYVTGGILAGSYVPPSSAPAQPCEGEQPAVAEPIQPSAPSLPTPDPDAWKSEDIKALGLKQSLEEFLRGEGLDTIGRIEQRRADVSQGKEKWPKGVGPAKITAIEDAITTWLAKNRDAAEFAKVAGSESAGGAVQDAAEAPAVDDSAEEPTSTVDPEFAALLSEKRASILAEQGESPEYVSFQRVWQQGYDAGAKGLDITACPLVNDAQYQGSRQDDWIRGWLSGMTAGVKGAVAGGGDDASPNEAESVDATTEPVAAGSLDEF